MGLKNTGDPNVHNCYHASASGSSNYRWLEGPRSWPSTTLSREISTPVNVSQERSGLSMTKGDMSQGSRHLRTLPSDIRQ